MASRKDFLMTTEEKESFFRCCSKWYVNGTGWEGFFKTWGKKLKERSDGRYMNRIEKNEIYGDIELGITLLEITYLRNLRWKRKEYILAFILVMNGVPMYDIIHLVFHGNYAMGSYFMEWAIKKGLAVNMMGNLVCSRRRWRDPLGWRLARFDYLKKRQGLSSARKFANDNGGEGFFEAINRLQWCCRGKTYGSYVLRRLWTEVQKKEPKNTIKKVEDFLEGSGKRYLKMEELFIDFLGGEVDLTGYKEEGEKLGSEY